jgi:hypothetical protein
MEVAVHSDRDAWHAGRHAARRGLALLCAVAVWSAPAVPVIAQGRVEPAGPVTTRADAHSVDYFPPPESQGGWRKLDKPEDIRRLAGMDPAKLDELKEWLQRSDKRDFAADVIRRGYVVLEPRPTRAGWLRSPRPFALPCWRSRPSRANRAGRRGR